MWARYLLLESIFLLGINAQYDDYDIKSYDSRSEIVPFRFPMMLGRAYDMSNDRIGSDLFSLEETSTPLIQQASYTESVYSLISTSEQSRNFLNVKGELSLKVKADVFEIAGKGQYLRDTEDRDKFVEILVKVDFTTVKHLLHSSAKPLPDCNTLRPDDLGTHYVRSLQYGGSLIASLRFIVDEKGDKEHIEAAVKGAVNVEGVLVGVEGEFKKLEEKLTSSYRLEIKLYGTMEISHVPQNMSEFLDLTRRFPSLAKGRNSEGIPITAEMYPVESLKECGRKINWRRNFALGADMNDIEKKFDELRQTRRLLSDWMKTVPNDDSVSIAELNSITFISTDLVKVERVFRQVISDLDVSETATVKQFDPAYEAYRGKDDFDMINKYKREFYRTKKEVERGGWGEWTGWEICNVPCGSGVNIRKRRCDNPSPFGDGKCDGEAQESKPCYSKRHCSADGKWCSWLSWSSWRVNCGQGKRTRTRDCACPRPRNSGEACEGSSGFTQSKACKTHCWYSGTAIFCGGGPTDCQSHYQRCGRSNCGDGKCCLTGSKYKCCSPEAVC